MKIDESLVTKVIDCILNATKPRKVILFGSAATNEITRDSDLDLLVIEDGCQNKREENLRLRNALRNFEMPVDVFVMTLERFEETKDVIGGLAYPANKYGRVIYEKS